MPLIFQNQVIVSVPTITSLRCSGSSEKVLTRVRNNHTAPAIIEISRNPNFTPSFLSNSLNSGITSVDIDLGSTIHNTSVTVYARARIGVSPDFNYSTVISRTSTMTCFSGGGGGGGGLQIVDMGGG